MTSGRTARGGIAGLLLLAGCASVSDDLQRYGEAVPPDERDRLACIAYLAEVQERIETAGVRDVEAERIAGFPYLRVDRFRSALGKSLGDEGADSERFDAWASELLALENEALAIEIGNLPEAKRGDLGRLARETWGPSARPFAAAEDCSARLLAADLEDPERRQTLLKKAKVPDSYSDFSRVFGFYPLMSLAASAGWSRWQEVHLPAFEMPADSLPVEGQLVDFVPAGDGTGLSAPEIAAILDESREPAFGRPLPQGEDLRRIVATFAPVWRIDVTGPFDRIGHPYWPAETGLAGVDATRPVVFTRVGHTLLDGEPLLQISYTAWFQERPPDGDFDILAGKFDGLIWRVTLGSDGRPLVYDTIHPCGCYHLFFPAPGTRLDENPQTQEVTEETAVPARAPAVGPDQRLVLRIEARSHYLKGLSRRDRGKNGADDVVYRMISDSELRALPLPGGGTRSLYQPDGLVAGSERLDRFLLWPMGVDSPGAMRQWGHHATAFVGRRHFDDPDLFEPMIAQ